MFKGVPTSGSLNCPNITSDKLKALLEQTNEVSESGAQAEVATQLRTVSRIRVQRNALAGNVV